MEENRTKNIGFNTSVFTGTRRAESTGQGLARILTAGAEAYRQKVKVDKVVDDRDEADKTKYDKMAWNSITLNQDTRRNQYIQTNPSVSEQESFERDLQTEASEFFGTASSEWASMSSSQGIGSYDSSINKLFAQDLDNKTQAMYYQTEESVKANPLVTIEEVQSAVSFLNEGTGVTGRQPYKAEDLYVKYSVSAKERAEATDPLKYNHEEWLKENPLLSQLNGAEYKDLIKEVESTMKVKRNKAITEKNSTYTGQWLGKIMHYSSIAELGMFNKEILSDEYKNPLITNQTRKPLLSYIKTLMSSDGKSKTKTESELKYAIKHFNLVTGMKSSNSVAQNETSLKNFTNNGFQVSSSLVNGISETWGAEYPEESRYRTAALVENYKQNLNISMEVQTHQVGTPIPKANKDVSKTMLKSRYNTMFTSSIATGNFPQASASMNSLGVVPESFLTAFDSSITSGNDKDIFQNLAVISQVSKDKKSSSILNKNPMMSAILDVGNRVSDPKRITPILKELYTKEGKEKLLVLEKDIAYKLRADSDFQDLPSEQRSLISKKLAYSAMFTNQNAEEIIKSSNAEDEADRFKETISGISVLDPTSRYKEGELDGFLDMMAKYSPTGDSTGMSVRVDKNGAIKVYQGGFNLAVVDSKEELTRISDGYAYSSKENLGITSKVINGFGRSMGTLVEKGAGTVSDKFKLDLFGKILDGYDENTPEYKNIKKMLFPMIKDK